MELEEERVIVVGESKTGSQSPSDTSISLNESVLDFSFSESHSRSCDFFMTFGGFLSHPPGRCAATRCRCLLLALLL
jgi:hypothetical protein